MVAAPSRWSGTARLGNRQPFDQRSQKRVNYFENASLTLFLLAFFRFNWFRRKQCGAGTDHAQFFFINGWSSVNMLVYSEGRGLYLT